MKIKTIEPSKFKTTVWSGGETTEIYIYPPKSSYSERNFLFRISSATVNDKESVFTKLENVKRHLMVIEGGVKLEHLGFHSKALKEYETDEFLGDWETKSYGICRDFNLMVKGKNNSNLFYLDIDGENEKINFKRNNIYVLYSFDTNIKLCGFNFDKNNAVIISEIEDDDFINISGKGKVIVSSVETADGN